jgi:hypothetical protein
MPACKSCQAPIKWCRDVITRQWVPLNADNTAHRSTCIGLKQCRYCQAPILWKDHEGKRQAFNLDGQILHKDTCTRRDECNHCGQKIHWVLVEGKWLAFDRIFQRELHWSMCPKSPEGAKALIHRVVTLQGQVDALRPQNEARADQRVVTLEKEVARLREQVTKLEREIRYRDVELLRLTRKAEKIDRPS